MSKDISPPRNVSKPLLYPKYKDTLVDITDMPDGTHLIKYQDKQYQAFWQSYKLGKRLYVDAPTPEEALGKLREQIREIKKGSN